MRAKGTKGRRRRRRRRHRRRRLPVAFAPTLPIPSTPCSFPADLKQLFSLVPVLIAVTGRVMAPRPYRSEFSDTDAAIVEVGWQCHQLHAAVHWLHVAWR